MTMILVKPTHQHSKQIMAYRQAFLNSREQPYGSCSLQRFDSIDEWLEKVKIEEKGENLPPNRVPSTQFLGIEKGKFYGGTSALHALKMGTSFGNALKKGEFFIKKVRKCLIKLIVQ